MKTTLQKQKTELNHGIRHLSFRGDWTSAACQRQGMQRLGYFL